MKNFNLLNRLLSYSHEKRTPQRLRRYAAVLLMLLTLGVGQMWADTYSIALNTESFNTNNHKKTGDGSLTIHLDGQTTYEFKVVWNNGSDHWLGMGSNDNRTFVVSSISEWNCTWDGGENIILNTANEGDYVFTFAISGNKLSITYPSVTHPAVGYVYLNKTWSSGNAHLWNSAGSHDGTKWPGPGLPVTTIGDNDYFYCSTGDYANVKFMYAR